MESIAFKIVIINILYDIFRFFRYANIKIDHQLSQLFATNEHHLLPDSPDIIICFSGEF